MAGVCLRAEVVGRVWGRVLHAGCRLHGRGFGKWAGEGSGAAVVGGACAMGGA